MVRFRVTDIRKGHYWIPFSNLDKIHDIMFTDWVLIGMAKGD